MCAYTYNTYMYVLCTHNTSILQAHPCMYCTCMHTYMYVLYMYAYIHTYAPIHMHPYIRTHNTSILQAQLTPGTTPRELGVTPRDVSLHMLPSVGEVMLFFLFCFFYTSRDVSLHMLPSVGEVMCLCLCLCLCPCPCPCPCVCVTVHSHINPLKLVVATFRFTQKQLVIDTIT